MNFHAGDQVTIVAFSRTCLLCVRSGVVAIAILLNRCLYRYLKVAVTG